MVNENESVWEGQWGGVDLPFRDRVDAGRRLAAALAHLKGERPLVLAVPRGGVIVAAEVARELGGDLDVIVARKVGAPFSPELAVGAVASDGTRYIHAESARAVGVTDEYLERAIAEKMAEAKAREERYRGGRPALDARGRTVILVDDGLATGSTMIAAARSVRRRDPAKVVIAVPVAPPSTVEAMRREADEVVCLAAPRSFGAVGQFYRDFGQVEDEEVQRILGTRVAS
ncbi:MAG TPA: phosphoribosyltransferase family protein [Gemmatimonadaceae bacterium]|nr:phosphoribosyltransferase family protein [Gemmatimonadaceae bacterium]